MTLRRSAPVLFFALFLAPAGVARADAKWDPLRTTIPESVEDLKALQDTVTTVTAKCTPFTVGIRIGFAAGSGVIVSEDGLVLTAGHVAGEPNKKCFIILPDGTEVEAKTLGVNKKMDSGMMKIVGKNPDGGKVWPFAEMAKSSDLKKGQWLVSMGHPNGYKKGRPPVARLGQLKGYGDKKTVDISKNYLQTNCTLVGGDSGGPLFDLEGRLVGIHSQIGPSINWNLHVPVDAFKTDWDAFVKGEKVEPGKPMKAKIAVGIVFDDDDAEPAKVMDVEEGGPAAEAGLKKGDLITKVDGKKVASVKEFWDEINTFKPDDEVALTVKRGTKTMKVTITLARKK